MARRATQECIFTSYWFTPTTLLLNQSPNGNVNSINILRSSRPLRRPHLLQPSKSAPFCDRTFARYVAREHSAVEQRQEHGRMQKLGVSTNSTNSIVHRLPPSPLDGPGIQIQCHRIVQSLSKYLICKIQMRMIRRSEADSGNGRSI